MTGELLGVAEVAAVLGTSKQRANQLAATAEFPQPLVRLAATPVWDGAQIRKYAASRNRRPGAPRSLRPAGSIEGEHDE